MLEAVEGSSLHMLEQKMTSQNTGANQKQCKVNAHCLLVIQHAKKPQEIKPTHSQVKTYGWTSQQFTDTQTTDADGHQNP